MDETTSLLKRFRPFAGLLPRDRSRIPAEIIAGITLAALAIPEVLGYTNISGTPVITGIYTLLVPAALFAIFGSSRHLVVGADSATAAILASGLIGVAAAGSGEYLALAGLLALMVGVLLLLASLIGLGFMADFLSRTVLVGFLTGVGIQIALRALSELLGLPGHHHGTLMMIWSNRQLVPDLNPAVLTVAILVLAVIVGSRMLSTRFNRNIPGAMIAVIGAIIASWALDLQTAMPVVGTVPTGLPDFSLPTVSWSFALIWELLPTALAMLVVVLAQSAATARAYAQKYHERLDETRDLAGLGLANIGAGLTGTFVVNGSPTKTEMVDSAGGRTQLSLLVTAAIALLTLLFLTGPLSYLPKAVLSAVVLLIGLKLIDWQGLSDIYRKRRPEFWVALVTAAVVVVFGVEQGIIFAILFSLIIHTRHGYRPKNLLIVGQPGGHWQARALASAAQARPGLLIYRFNHSMYYANAERMQAEMLHLADTADPPLRWFCIDASSVDDVDYTAIDTLAEVGGVLKDKGITMVFAQDVDAINAKSRQELQRQFRDAPFFASLDDVLDRYEQNAAKPDAL
ncbi:MAG: SulP family inorganic anion transporter [Alphaproteobacteria bacterium]|nr:SulP family inorganic anion transporter [Alphaproteobacteria bacterium]